ncbi:hypothetical protein [Roseateles sp.]|uniref:hypothetical protein n=1 Tax=Roseateles sp. TaxID=1971397 RepID=UPI00387E5046
MAAYLGHWSGFARVQAWVFFHWMLPLLVRLLGHVPGRVLGLGAHAELLVRR